MRKIECPYCKGEVLSEQNGRTTSSASLWPRLQNVLTTLSDLIASVLGGTKTVSRKEAIGGTCGACNNKGYIEDPTDTSQNDEARADYLKSQEKTSTALEGRRGHSPGGSRVTRIAFDDVLIVGHEFNDAKSYDVVENVAGPGNKVAKQGGRAAVDAGTTEHTQVNGKNVPTNGGGQYVIRCGNRFQLLAGSQGISLKTSGPIELDGSIVSFTGADMTFGTRIGQTSIAGNHVVIEGKNISITPTGKSGQVGINGSIAATGNLQAGGAYIDNLYSARITTPGKQVSTKASTGGRFIGGPPSWGGTNIAALRNAVIDLQKLVTERVTDLNLFTAGGPQTPRFAFNLSDAMFNVVYSALPIESRPTGICVIQVAGIPIEGLIYNFPHHHIQQDNPHSHEVKVPAINYEQHDTADSVIAAFDVSAGNTAVAAAGGTSDYIGGIASSALGFAGAVQSLVSPTLQGNTASVG